MPVDFGRERVLCGEMAQETPTVAESVAGKVNALLAEKYERMPFGLKVAVVKCVEVLEELGVGDKVWWPDPADTQTSIEGLAMLIWGHIGKIGLLPVINHPMVAEIIGRKVAKDEVAGAIGNLTQEEVSQMGTKVPRATRDFIDSKWKNEIV